MIKKNTPVSIKKTVPSQKKIDLIEYARVLTDIKKLIEKAQIKAVLSVHKELLLLYWEIGRILKVHQTVHGWGSSTIEKFAHELQHALPGVGGFSRSNIFRMHAFFSAYEKVAQPARQLDDLPIFAIPWFHNVTLIQKVKNTEERLWYAQATSENGWSRNVLIMQIDSGLYKRQGKAITNFKTTLAEPHSDLAQQSLKDPYVFDFLTLKSDYLEKDLEQGLIDHVQKLLLELGKGFAFVGRQHHITVGGNDYYIDLLFYHYKLRCFIVVELKTGEFDPRDAGQLNFYLSAVDDQLKAPEDAPTIGLLLCKNKNNVIAEYALRDIRKPMGLADYHTHLVEKLPKNLKSSLPSIKELEAELEKQELVATHKKVPAQKVNKKKS